MLITSRSNLDSIFTSAFQAYKEMTGKDITSHPLAIEIQSCQSPDAILAVLRQQIPLSSRSQSTDERFTKWLIPTVNVLYAFSATLGEGVSLVNIYKEAPLVENMYPNIRLSGVLTSKSNFCRHRYPPPGLSLPNS